MGFLDNLKEVLKENQLLDPSILSSSESEEEEADFDQDDLPPLQQQRHEDSRRKRVRRSFRDGSSCRKCNIGRRWARRLENRVFLQNLIHPSNEEDLEDIGLKSPTVFERLMKDEKSMKVWREFISQPEEKQRDVLNLSDQACPHANKTAQVNTKQVKGNKYFSKLCPLIKEFLLSEDFPKNTLLCMEPCVIEYFQASPCGQYTSVPLMRNDRKVLHGLAQYLDLSSKSYKVKVHSSCEFRSTTLTNTKDTFTVPEILLSEFLEIS